MIITVNNTSNNKVVQPRRNTVKAPPQRNRQNQARRVFFLYVFRCLMIVEYNDDNKKLLF